MSDYPRERCPVCGKGEIVYRAAGRMAPNDPPKPLTRSFGCGHVVVADRYGTKEGKA